MDFLKKIFYITYEKGNFISAAYPTRLTFYILGIKIAFNLNTTMFGKKHKALLKCCDIEDLDYIIGQGAKFTHMTGIIINKDVRIGKDCIIRHNVTIGQGKFNEEGRCYPILGDRVDIGAGAIIIGGITVGDDAIIGAGAVVVKDIPAGATVAGNPAKIIKQRGSDET